MSESICLDKNYSTTRLLTKKSSKIINNSEYSKGGLRIQGYFKHSYKEKPLISIVTVVYNGEEFLEETIQSVINQSYANVEYIIIDGGSTDGTIDIIKKYEDKIDYWVSEKDNGIYDAMNKGIKVANGDWIYFLGADDILYNILNDLIKEFDTEKDAIYGDVYMPKKHKLYNGKFSKFNLMFNNICHQAIFYNKKIFKNKKFDLKYKILADYALNLSIFTSDKFIYYPVLVANYNDKGGVSSNNKDLIFQKDKLNIIKQSFGLQLYLIFKIRTILVNILSLLKIKNLIKGFIVE